MVYERGSVVHIGITGSRDGWSVDQRQDFVDGLHDIIDESQGCERIFHHGDAMGVDVEAAKIAHKLGYLIVAHPPENEKVRAFHDSDVITSPDDYLARDQNIVDVCDEIFGIPKSMTDVSGGTWYTVIAPL